VSEPDTGPTTVQRVLVLVALTLLLVSGLGGIEAWPLSEWRLFSLARDEDQTRWVVEAALPRGRARTVSLEELPLRYRHAEWPMAELPDESVGQRQRVCDALLDAVLEVEPATTELRILRDRQTLVEDDDEWVVLHDPEVVHTCRPAAGPT